MQEADTLGGRTAFKVQCLRAQPERQSKVVAGDHVIHRAELLGAISAWHPT